MLQVFYLDVAYVCNGFQVFFMCNVSNACFKCFICLETYVSNAASERFESISGVTHVATGPTFCSHQLQLLGRRRAGTNGGGGTSGPRAWSSGAGDVRAARAPCGRAKRRRGKGVLARGQSVGVRETKCSCRCPFRTWR
jgi:hypothetical protein